MSDEQKRERRPTMGFSRDAGRFTKARRQAFEMPAELQETLTAFAGYLRNDPKTAVHWGLARRLYHAEFMCSLLGDDVRAHGATTANGALRTTAKHLERWSALYSRLMDQLREVTNK